MAAFYLTLSYLIEKYYFSSHAKAKASWHLGLPMDR